MPELLKKRKRSKSKGKVVSKKKSSTKKQNITQTVIVHTSKPRTRRSKQSTPSQAPFKGPTATESLIATLISKFQLKDPVLNRDVLKVKQPETIEERKEETILQQMEDPHPSTDHTTIEQIKRGRPTKGESDDDILPELRRQVDIYMSQLTKMASVSKKEQKLLQKYNRSNKDIGDMNVTELKQYTPPNLRIRTANVSTIRRVLLKI